MKSKKEAQSKSSAQEKKKGTKKFWSSEKIMSLAALIVSAGTLFTITYQNLLIRKQQYASARPHLVMTVSNHIDPWRYELNLTNNGLGPAVINGISFSYQGRQYDDWFPFYYGALYEKGFKLSQTGLLSKEIKYLMPSQETILVIGGYDQASFNRIDSIWRYGSLKINYSSLYEEKFTYDNGFTRGIEEQINKAESELLKK